MKMNIFYKFGFILFLISLVLLVLTTVFGYVRDDRILTTALGVNGTLTALCGIIFVCVSKPEKDDSEE